MVLWGCVNESPESDCLISNLQALLKPAFTCSSPQSFCDSHGRYRVPANANTQHGDAYVDSEMQVDGHIGGIRACTAKKTSGKNKDLKVLLSITSDHFSQVAADPLKCETAARSAREFVNFYDLDGVDGKSRLLLVTYPFASRHWLIAE